MIVIELRPKDGVPVRYEFDAVEIQLGSLPHSQLVLPGADPRHARLLEKDGRLIIVDLKSDTGMYVNGRRITSPIVLRPPDRVYIGDFTFHAAAALNVWPDDADVTPIVEATEIRLLSEIGGGDDDARMVYADWLDERGRADRAELLRLQHAFLVEPDRDARPAIRQRMQELVTTIEPRWRLRVARPVIAGCTEARCPQWAGMQATERKHIRLCGSCMRHAVFCVRPLEIAVEKGLGNHVVIDFPVDDPDDPVG